MTTRPRRASRSAHEACRNDGAMRDLARKFLSNDIAITVCHVFRQCYLSASIHIQDELNDRNRHHLEHRRPDSLGGRYTAVPVAGGGLGHSRRSTSSRLSPHRPRRCMGGRLQGVRRLSVPDRHDASVGACPARRAVRLGGGDRHLACQGVSPPAVRARLHRRRGRNGVFVERRHRSRAHAGRLCGMSGSPGEGPHALPAGLRLHRQCRKLRAADFQPGQSGHLRRRRDAASVALDANLPAAVDRLDHRYIRLPLLDTEAGAGGRRDRTRCRPACAFAQRPAGRMGSYRNGSHPDRGLGHESRPRHPDIRGRRPYDDRRPRAHAAKPHGDGPRHKLERVAPGCGSLRDRPGG